MRAVVGLSPAVIGLLVAVAVVISCGNDSGKQDVADVGADVDVEADALEVPDATEDDAAETPDEASDEELLPDEAGSETEDSVREDGAGPEEDGDGEGGDAAEDGEAVDPCAPPEIPSAGLYLFFCLGDGAPPGLTLTLWRWISQEWGPNIP